MSLHHLKDYQNRHRKTAKRQVHVPFTKWQYETVHAFLKQLRESGKVEAELGAPIEVRLDWSAQNEVGHPHVLLQGSHSNKTIPLKLILDAAADLQAKAHQYPSTTSTVSNPFGVDQ